ncbi:FAD-dependent monooxygenase [Streptomyces alkaliterrae]|uniref:FAD-dependent monooxygenase n=1 Tax=Streptomyces alkaliterrae TaxID=2213162 RepID=A0A5P0YKC0_9ACTN|nr:FAD-dependent monooxygenase [Streptomyces alkaliterrae]MBB1251952.1 FAD-dependent monooxygenase [Streptomyces alkaliterrae]MBB1257359.1 FAD-dependent monooxygenase [Streptomyces alkaliterrae]MQS00746.1 NAD(P)-binding protein [Streptomyces alkaliterrae]
MSGGPRALVIGAGIGGLTAAVALHQRGWQVSVHERAASLEPVGAAISIAPNGQRALDVIGLGDAVRDQIAWTAEGGIRRPDGRWLARTDAAAAAERFGGGLALVHRAHLVDLLRARLPREAVHTGSAGRLLDPGEPAGPGRPGRPAVVATADGEREAELVVAADGVASPARRLLFPDHPGPRYAGFTTWRLMADDPDGRLGDLPAHETWGSGALWGTHRLRDGRIYAYAAAPAPAGARAPDDERRELLRRFGTWHAPIPALIEDCPPRTVLRHDVYTFRRPLPAHHRGRTVLLGDAAHAMPPSLGQGGNQAVEDAVVLAHHADPDTADHCPAPAAHTRDRLPRTTDVLRRSRRAGALTTVANPLAVLARDTLTAAVSRLGPHLALRALDGVADWSPPGTAYPSPTAAGRSENTDGRRPGRE